jgi:hypothetical protein
MRTTRTGSGVYKKAKFGNEMPRDGDEGFMCVRLWEE